MAGVTDAAFRILCREAGAAMVSTEMVSDLSLLAGSRRSRVILAISPQEHPVSCQLCGSRPEAMARAARVVLEQGVDVVDLNMGCPAPKIVATGEGAALMRQPSLAQEIVRAVREALPPGTPLTAKIRAGWDEGDGASRQGEPEAVRFGLVLEAAGVDAIAVHGRWRSQFYRGRADWGVIRLVKQALRIPVIGNGDVRSGGDALRMLAETGCDGVMIGRGVLGRPELFSECLAAWQGPVGSPVASAPAPRIEIALRHLRMSLVLKGPRRGVVEMRKHGAWYVVGRSGAARLRDQLMRAEDVRTFEECLRAGMGN
jgi:nifR3 family TIM-barrel protein